MQENNFEREIQSAELVELTEQEKELELMLNIIKVKNELDVANSNFEYAQDDLIDYYTYQIKANRAKFDYLVKKAKNLGLSLDMIEQIDIKYNKAI